MVGNTRYLINEDDLKNTLKQKYRIRSYEYTIKENDFCGQINAVWVNIPVVFIMHGAHILPLVMLSSNTTVVEILPRNLQTSYFCGLYRANNNKAIILTNSLSSKLYEATDWCNNREIFWNIDNSLKSYDLLRKQDILTNLIYLNVKEVNYIAEIIWKEVKHILL